jgi:ABC-type glutathione transport system ATPase component
VTSLLSVNDLRVAYPGRTAFDKPKEILHGVSVQVGAGETLGLVGESGSGKTTLGRAVLGLVKPSGGEVVYDGKVISSYSRAQRRSLSSEIQVVFQDPYTSLNPSLSINDILAEPLVAQGKRRDEARNRIKTLLELVNLPSNALDRYPREFSGGQRQRIAIARALALEPRLIVCDEPVSALDLTNQARVLDLLVEIQERTGVAYLFVSHDLSVVRHICHRVAVMYRGDIVETGPAAIMTATPSHPYSQALLLAAPVTDPAEQRARRETRQRLQRVSA